MVDNTLALQIRPPDIQQFNAAAPLLAAAQLQHAGTANALAQFNLSREQRQDANRQQALGLFSSNDPQAATKAFALDPEIGIKLQQFRSSARENEVKEFQNQNDMVARTGIGVLSAPPEQRAMLYTQERQRLIKMGIVKPEMVPEVYNEGFLRSAVQRAQSVSEFLSQPMVGGQPISNMGGGAAPAGAPAAPAAPQGGAASFSPGMTGGVIDRIVGVESGGSATAKNPRSSATGAGQFISSTWLDTLKSARPDLAAGKSDRELLALRNDPNLSREMVTAYAAANGKVLSDAGLPVTPGTTYLAHFAGPQGARAVLSANPGAPVGQILGADVVKANPFLRGMTAGQLVAWADRKMAGTETGATPIANAPGMVAPTNTAALAPGMMSPALMSGGTAPAAPPPARLGVAPIPGQPGGPQPVTIKGKPYTEGAPPGMQWMMAPDGKWTQAPVPGSEQSDKELVKVNDPTSPTGERFVPRYQATGAIPAKDATEGQANANLYSSRMQNSEKIIQKFEQSGTSLFNRSVSSVAEGSYTPALAAGMANKSLGGDFQQLRQAETDFVNAVLRRESGAVISPSEFAGAARQYLPQPGDSKEVLAQKRENRRLAVQGINRAAQPGYGASGPTGTPPPGASPAAPSAPASNLPPLPPGFVLAQ